MIAARTFLSAVPSLRFDGFRSPTNSFSAPQSPGTLTCSGSTAHAAFERASLPPASSIMCAFTSAGVRSAIFAACDAVPPHPFALSALNSATSFAMSASCSW